MTELQAKQLGQHLVDFLYLKPLPATAKEKEAGNIRYRTDWGTKTLEGLGRCVEHMVAVAKG